MTNNPEPFVIYHNPRCSKSREALALLQQRGIEPKIIEYLKTPPAKEELREIIKKLAIKPEALLRKGEEVFKQYFAGRDFSDAECITAMVEFPVLIGRPIIIRGDRAVVGRSLERINELF
jgi:arsenate reductase (glutaredoxin)